MKKEIKVLSIKDPHASLFLTPYKTIETRSWPTSYRGEIYLHVSKSVPSYRSDPAMWDRVNALLAKHKEATGIDLNIKENHWKFENSIFARATLSDCIEMTAENISGLSQDEIDAGYYTPGRYMWVLKDITPIPEIARIRTPGRLGIWSFTYDTDFYNLDCSADDYFNTIRSVKERIGKDIPGARLTCNDQTPFDFFIFVDTPYGEMCGYYTDESAVNKIVRNAFTDEDYQDIVDEINQKITLRSMIHSIADAITETVPGISCDVFPCELTITYEGHPNLRINLLNWHFTKNSGMCFGWMSNEVRQHILYLAKNGEKWIDAYDPYRYKDGRIESHIFEEKVQEFMEVPYGYVKHIL